MTMFHYSTARVLHDERAARLVAEVAAHRLAREAGRSASKRTGLAAPSTEVARVPPVRPVRPAHAVHADQPDVPEAVETTTDWLADRRAS